MNRLGFVSLLVILFFGSGQVLGQENNVRQFSWDKDSTLLLDSLLIYPNSLELYCKGKRLSSSDFTYNYPSGKLDIFSTCDSVFELKYRVMNLPRDWVYQKRDSSLLYNKEKDLRERFLIQNIPANENVFGGSALNKAGSISRGITFGNNQNLGVNSSLNLELSGDIAPNLKLLAVLSDDNLPIQPDGNTNQLREFDQVFVQIYNEQFKLIAGDFWLRKPKGYFLTYQKRAQGLTFEKEFQIDSVRRWKTQFSGALSRGKFNRQIIQGVEGNQGPYRLIGAENEPFIIVLSGTEQVYIDGRLLQRGQEFDYTINYNTAEVIFTSRNLITKDSRIAVEFQYTDQNYARSILQSSISYEGPKLHYWFNAFVEQDAKNQSLQQKLSLDQKRYLSSIGDSIQEARILSIDSTGFLDNQVLYALRDSLGFDSVLVYSAHPDSALYRAVFFQVGMGKGDYIFSHFNALGRVYKWVSPVNGVSQGDHVPARLLVTPKKQRLISSGLKYKLSKNWTFTEETAFSLYDINTFSPRDSRDDNDMAQKVEFQHLLKAKDSLISWSLENKAIFEFIGTNFKPIQQFRAVEFDRDWNVRGKNYQGEQYLSAWTSKWTTKKLGAIQVDAQRYSIGRDYEGYSGRSNGSIRTKGLAADWNGSYTESKAEQRNQYIRNKMSVSQKMGPLRLGYKDDFEQNKFQAVAFPLSRNSYRFYDYQTYVSNDDSASFLVKAFYQERYDWLSDSTNLRQVAKAQTVGGEWTFKNLQNQNLTLLTNYRRLNILDSTLLKLTPEDNLLGRLDYEIRLWKGALTFSNFYEIGSGLELRKEFLYIQVNAGQGIYTWIDYNQDGVKDLNEFELAQFIDQANYIRVFTPSNRYEKVFSNELNQSLAWRPERIWSTKKGPLKYLSLLSSQTRFRTTQKTSGRSTSEAIDPRQGSVLDTNLISSTSNFRNTFYFNRTSSIFSTEYSYQKMQSKVLLASGFDGRAQTYHEVKPQVNILRKFLVALTWQKGQKLVNADYTIGRNYDLQYEWLEPLLAFQPSTSFRLSVGGKYTEKSNRIELGGEKAYLGELNTELRFNQADNGSFQAGFKTIQINYNGNSNSALGFEMLEGLKTGVNYTWNVGYQRSISKNLQLSLQYNGRKSENTRTIHSGGMEVRAFF